VVRLDLETTLGTHQGCCYYLFESGMVVYSCGVKMGVKVEDLSLLHVSDNKGLLLKRGVG